MSLRGTLACTNIVFLCGRNSSACTPQLQCTSSNSLANKSPFAFRLSRLSKINVTSGHNHLLLHQQIEPYLTREADNTPPRNPISSLVDFRCHRTRHSTSISDAFVTEICHNFQSPSPHSLRSRTPIMENSPTETSKKENSSSTSPVQLTTTSPPKSGMRFI